MARNRNTAYLPDLTVFDISHPVGNNSLSARANFYQRTIYERNVYPRSLTQPIDTWYSKNLFGRVDRLQYTIMPKNSSLTLVGYASNPNVYCISFVNAAFSDFVAHMQKAAITNCLDPRGNSEIINMRAMMGWSSPLQAWNNYKAGIIRAYIDAFRANPRKLIKNYNDFKPGFIGYLKQIAKMSALTKTNFLLTNQVNPFMGGLTLSISGADCGDDANKYTQWIKDPNYHFYVQAAKKFGFAVNKNMPWQLTADLFTDATQKYLSQYRYSASGTLIEDITTALDPHATYIDEVPVDPSNFFDAYYNRAYVNDLEDLNDLVLDAYIQFIDEQPTYADEKIKDRGQCGGSLVIKHYRREKLYGSRPRMGAKDLLDLYIDIRFFEARSPTDITIVVIRRRAYEIYRQRLASAASRVEALDEPLRYINALFKEYIYPSTYRNINPSYSLDSVRASGIIDTAGEIGFATSGVAPGGSSGPTSY